MSALAHLTRSWPVFAALGAGIVLIAVGAGAMGAPTWGIAAAAALVGGGLAALVWAVAALRTGRMPVPGVALSAALGLVAASGVVLASGAASAASISALPLLAADVFALVVAIGAAATLRSRRADAAGGRRDRAEAARSARRPAVAVIGMLVGATLVAALATPALAGTRAGEQAVPHGELHGEIGHHH